MRILELENVKASLNNNLFLYQEDVRTFLKIHTEALLDLYKVNMPVQEKIPDEPWISVREFVISTQLCTPSFISWVYTYQKDQFSHCLKKERSKLYVRSDAIIKHFSIIGGVKIKDAALQYLKNKEAQACHSKMPPQPLS